MQVESVDGVAGVLIASDQNDPVSCIHQAWFSPCPKEFYSFSPLHHFVEVCREKRTHA